MLLFNRVPNPTEGMAVEDAARFVRERIPVFEVSNLSDYISNASKTDVFTHPYGPPFDQYWMEFRTPGLLSGEKYDRIGMMCSTVPGSDPSTVAATVTMFVAQRKKAYGPIVTWLVEFQADGPPGYRMLHVPTDTIVDQFLDDYRSPDGDRAKRFKRGDPFPVTGIETFDEPLRSQLLAAKDRWDTGTRMTEEDVATLQQARDHLDARIADINLDLAAATEQARFSRRKSFVLESYVALHVVLFAHALLACKNVNVQTVTPPSKLAKRAEKRHGQTMVTYKTIAVTPAGGGSGGHGHNDVSGNKSLHIVRGHFKTFTEDRKLFGRHTGTYWWSPTLKGDASAGVTVSDYTVG